MIPMNYFFFSSRRRHTRWPRDWSSDVCSSDLEERKQPQHAERVCRLQSQLLVMQTLQPIIHLSSVKLAEETLALCEQRRQRLRSEERRVGKEFRARQSPWKRKRDV